MRSRVVPTIALLGAAILAGCSGGDAPDTAAESFVLYSIDGRGHDTPGYKAPPGVELFHGSPVLGKIGIEDAKTREELSAAFQKGIAGKGRGSTTCFRPRHGIRIVRGGKTTDYIICFECHQYVALREGIESEMRAIDASPQEKFNEILKRANVPLAPSAFEATQ
jgi:hypothetical protein